MDQNQVVKVVKVVKVFSFLFKINIVYAVHISIVNGNNFNMYNIFYA